MELLTEALKKQIPALYSRDMKKILQCIVSSLIQYVLGLGM
ncbi:MAG: hypothetical protein ACREHC_05330 [Candidatus Levyibacteriota bacterium]